MRAFVCKALAGFRAETLVRIGRGMLGAGLLALAAPWAWAGSGGNTQQLQAESRLLSVIQQIEDGQLNEALAEVWALNRDVPDFHSAQLLQAQILEFKAGRMQLDEMQALMRQQQQAAHVQNLQLEIRQRLQANQHGPQSGMVPKQFVALAPDVQYAVAVDASKSRLYLFVHNESGLHLMADFYISVGRLGVHKNAEGDERTPTGVYFITSKINGERLPDLYGVGALPLNYPNDWDRKAGRTGSGIWLHGSPSDIYARLPLASDGCVVLSNPDMAFLLQNLGRRTPVLIMESLEWIDPAVQAQQTPFGGRNPRFAQEVENWRRVWQQLPDKAALASVYAPELLDNQAFIKRVDALKQHLQTKGVELKNVSVYAWEDGLGELRIVNVETTGSPTYKNGLSLRQYWRKSPTGWVIFSEDLLSQLP